MKAYPSLQANAISAELSLALPPSGRELLSSLSPLGPRRLCQENGIMTLEETNASPLRPVSALSAQRSPPPVSSPRSSLDLGRSSHASEAASKSAFSSFSSSHPPAASSDAVTQEKLRGSERNSRREIPPHGVASTPTGKNEGGQEDLGVRTLEMRGERPPGDGDELLLNRKFIGDQGCKGVTASLMKRTNFVRIDLSANNITSQGLAALLPGLAVQRSLKHLDLNWNSLASPGNLAGSSGAGSTSSSRCMYTLQTFCDWVSTHGSLHTLTLAHCRLGNQGAACMADALNRNTSLVTVDLSHNGVGAAACTLLVQAVENSNKTVLHVDLTGNSASYASLSALERACARNRVNRHVACLQRKQPNLQKSGEKLQQLQTYVLQLEREVALRQDEFSKIIDDMHADAAEAARRLDEAQEEVRQLKEKLRSVSFDLVAEKKKGLDAENLKKEIHALQLSVSSRETEVAELRSRVQQLEAEKQLHAEDAKSLRSKSQALADASLLTQQSLDDANMANKQLEACLHQSESRLAGLSQQVANLRRQLVAAEGAAEEQRTALLSRCQATQEENRKLEEKVFQLEREQQQLEQKRAHLAWSLEKEEREREQWKLQEEEKRKEERQTLQEQAEEWKNKCALEAISLHALILRNTPHPCTNLYFHR
ncbi:putative myosin heavy chain [Toxoplasma gondii GAB2-2007-GAL-DOM2]|uniref:Putative myosin heavy chain n=1 Tax=Toxoplasma gondii GAB2-2007-GAL-DOM2 TaxID=1130820 RepID=A0A086JRN1_TOXGO|nr:putative myosin heavy chain [Toxoplasma gondii GAB2-2007-GAL-DOM2]